ncbi:MAG: RNA polymerase sigma factor SigJ [Archangium gephyra]|uniref:RNA polymerase sigma factor SigJ n=1 Tax=Archangium gephyra TaxID=48 RepID=A0A2W5T8R7_9BACT|nr:MAG: RNA polymerase sigma factor SigJ [Archangium gephyra]
MNDFEPHREFLLGVAYRMLGSLAEAEDIVQDAFLRWSGVDASVIENPRAHLAKIVSRLCLDRMKSAAARREQYVGMWLPDPLVQPVEAASVDDLSVALLLSLERLSPLERAAFLLHDVFDMDYPSLAETLGRSEAACRQLATRAREHVRNGRPRFTPSPRAAARFAEAFRAALTGKLDEFAALLADDAVVYSDGGGKRLAPLKPIFGKEKIVRFFEGTARKGIFGPSLRSEPVRINGMPGFVIWTDAGPETMSLEIENERIVAIYAVRNPDKLRHLAKRSEAVGNDGDGR